jgi:signal transduction histidine kinase/CheY-like chemotaxis protein/integral membrane sensor domain MASE1
MNSRIKEVGAFGAENRALGPVLLIILSISALYALLGWLGLALAIPPGYASPVFPAAGFALAVTLHYGLRVLPAVWLGSLLLNMGVSLMNGSLSATTFLVAAGIGTGAVLQAWAGQHLIQKRLTPKALELNQEKDVFQFLALGGTVACLIAATAGVTTLLISGIVPSSAVGYSWWSWYVGDVLGVFTAAPLVLGALQRNRASWRARLLVVAPPVFGVLALAVLMFLAAARWELANHQSKIDDQGNMLAQALDHRFIAHREMLASLARVIEITPDLGLAQFDYFTKTTLRDHQDLFALSYNPYVTLEQRQEVERRMARLYPHRQFQITERDAQRSLVRAGERPEYVTVGYISPLEGNWPAIGFDINSEPKRRDAIIRARVLGRSAATSPIQLVQEEQKRPGVLVLTPAFRQGAITQELIGFAVAVIKVDQMVDIAIKNKLAPGLIMEIEDPAAEAGYRVLYRSGGTPTAAQQQAAWQAPLMMADRKWVLRIIPTEAYLQQHRPWLAWVVGVVGLVLAALLQMLMLGVTGRAAQIQRRVDEQTEEIRAAMRGAEAANLAKSQFLGTMSHEIRTPMNGILGMGQLLLPAGVSEAQRQDYARTILQSGRTLLNLLNDILDFSKIEAGKVSLEKVGFDPRQVLQETATLFSSGANNKGLSMAWSWAGDGANHYLGDTHRIHQMLSNLVGNAIKFTDVGGISIEGREISGSGNLAELEFSVSDTGIGMEKEQAARLFTPFTQADGSTTRKYGGTGLGLSIVKSLSQLMGGDAGVQSTPGAGSRFWFRVRVERSAPAPLVKTKEPVAGLSSIGADRAYRFEGKVLVVEDNTINQKVIFNLLGKLGLEVCLAKDGQLALDAVQNDPAIDLVLMDLQMPVMDGYTSTTHIRAWELQQGKKRLPIIALTADAFAEDRERCLQTGMDDFLPKPVDIHAMMAVLAKFLPHHGRHSEPAPPDHSSVDSTVVVAKLRELAAHLKLGRVQALKVSEELQEIIRSTGLAAEFAAMERHMHDLRFGSALAEIRRIASERGWSLEET